MNFVEEQVNFVRLIITGTNWQGSFELIWQKANQALNNRVQVFTLGNLHVTGEDGGGEGGGGGGGGGGRGRIISTTTFHQTFKSI